MVIFREVEMSALQLDLFIGHGEFNHSFLTYVSQNSHVHQVGLYRIEESVETLIGILAYKNYTFISEIILIAKPVDSPNKNIARQLLRHHALNPILILRDDSQNPGFYEYIGFTSLCIFCHKDHYISFKQNI